MSQARIYHMDECVIPVPDGYRDRTTHVLEWPLDAGHNLILTVSRDTLPPGAGFEEYVQRETKGLSGRYRGFKLDRDESGTLAGGLAIARKTFRWSQEAKVVYNHLAFANAGALIVLFVATARAADREVADRLVDDALAELRFREV